MADRDAMIAAFLAGTPWEAWHKTAITGDASSRRYMRLTDGAVNSAILMDAPPENGESTDAFARIAELLDHQGLCPPKVLAHDPVHGLMLLSDLGPCDFADWLRAHPKDQHTLYRAATDVLIRLTDAPIPDALPQLTPDVAGEMVGIVGTYYAKRPVPDLTAAIAQAFAIHAPLADTLSLRDFHAENLIWRADLTGLDRIGLLDFQDAFVAPAGYDLVSLLRDVRREISAEVITDAIAYYCAQTRAQPGFDAQLACLGVQRNLRILGVFARLATDLGKARYLDFMPRTWAHICTDLEHPALHDLKEVVLDTVPAPTPALLKRLAA